MWEASQAGGTKGGAVADYRIDELARLAETTVRNIRVYQDRGLLAPPRRQGRIGIYDEVHLSRLRLINRLLARGYTFAHITELVTAWEEGRDLADVLGLEQVLTSPFTDEEPTTITLTRLRSMFKGDASPANVKRAVELGILQRAGVKFRVPSPRLLNAGAELYAGGVPLRAILDLAEQLERDTEVIAKRLVDAVAQHVLGEHPDDWLPSGPEVPALAEFVSRLRPVALQATEALLARSLSNQIHQVLGEVLVRLEKQTIRAGHAEPSSGAGRADRAEQAEHTG